MKLRLLAAAVLALGLSACSESSSLPTSPTAPQQQRGPAYIIVSPDGGGVTSMDGGPGDVPPPITCDSENGWSPWFDPASETWKCKDESGHIGGGVG
jgi:hypothetical protein